MNRIGFDNDKYVKLQSQNIRDRIQQFGGKLYLEFGGKLFDDYHASRVLPGFQPDSKVRMLLEMKEDAEIVIAISADDIERGSLTVEERRNLPLALVGLIFLHFYPCYCVDTICPNIV